MEICENCVLVISDLFQVRSKMWSAFKSATIFLHQLLWWVHSPINNHTDASINRYVHARIEIKLALFDILCKFWPPWAEEYCLFSTASSSLDVDVTSLHRTMLHTNDSCLTQLLAIMMSSNGNIFHVTGHSSLAFVRGIHLSLVNSPHKGQWRRALMFSLICAWINGWVNNREAGDLRSH